MYLYWARFPLVRRYELAVMKVHRLLMLIQLHLLQLQFLMLPRN
jgi:hypothetical protein